MDHTSATTYCVNTSNLPDDVLTYTDEKFYNFVKEKLGQSAVDLLNLQAINNVPSFLLSDDLFDIIEHAVASKEIKILREKISFAFPDGTFRVKIGLKNNFRYLNKLLTTKLDEENKKKRNPIKKPTKINSIPSSLIENNSTLSQSTSLSNSTTSLLAYDTSSTSPLSSTENTDLPPSLVTEDTVSTVNTVETLASSTTNTNSTPLPSSATNASPESSRLETTDTNSKSSSSKATNINLKSSSLKTKEEHIESILVLINKWTNNSKENLELEKLELMPDIDFTLNIKCNENDFEGLIKCKCGTRIRLMKKDDRFQITNFYKHLRSVSCSMMKAKKQQYDKEQELSNTIHDDNNNDLSDGDDIDDQFITSRQPLSNLTSNVLQFESQPVGMKTSNGIKRSSSTLRHANSQSSSTKKTKK